MARKRVRMTVFRQFVVGITLTVFNLFGALLTLAAIGGRGDWTVWQFFGLFGLLEWATGIAIVLGPNVWQLPIKRALDMDADIKLDLRALLTPHWAPGVKAVGGFVIMCAAAVHEGVGLATPGILVEAALIVVSCMAASVLIARWGVARPDLDVLHFIVKRPTHRDRELPGISIGAMFVQLIINVLTIPATKLFGPSALYQPELGPSLGLLGGSAAFAGILTAAALLAWRGKIRWSGAHSPKTPVKAAGAEA